MDKIRFSIIGTGWRSLFYLRIAKALPNIFELLAVKVRNKEKEDFFLKQKVRCVYSDEEIINDKPDFVVVCVNKTSLFDVSMYYLKRGMNVFCETPLSVEKSKLLELYNRLDMLPAELMIAEQYPFMPYYQIIREIIDSKLIGRVQSVHLSTCHDYHTIALARSFLGEKEEGKLLFLDKTEESFLETGDRNGPLDSDVIRPVVRKRFIYRFKDGKTFSYDFSSEQYHTRICGMHLIIHGDEGEICDNEVILRDYTGVIHTIKDDNGYFLSNHLVYKAKEDNLLPQPLLQGFQNPYPGAALNEDEIAICILLENFKGVISKRELPVYSLKESLLDAIIATELY